MIAVFPRIWQIASMIPNLPTDNLYKFWSLSGLFICIVGVGYPLTLIKQDSKDMRETKKAIALTAGRADIAVKRADRLRSLAEQKSSKLKETSSKLEGISENITSDLQQKGTSEAKGRAEEHLAKLELLKKLYSENNAELLNLTNLSDDAREKILLHFVDANDFSTVYGDTIKHMVALYVAILLVEIFGLSLTINGFRQWYNKVQRYQDALLKQQAEDLRIWIPPPLERFVFFPRHWKFTKSKPVDYEI